MTGPGLDGGVADIEAAAEPFFERSQEVLGVDCAGFKTNHHAAAQGHMLGFMTPDVEVTEALAGWDNDSQAMRLA